MAKKQAVIEEQQKVREEWEIGRRQEAREAGSQKQELLL